MSINGVLNDLRMPPVINGGKAANIGGNRPYDYNKWRMNWNGHMFAPPDPGCVLYLPGDPGFGTTIFDYSYNFADSGIDTDEELTAVETGIDCDADATTAIPVGSIIIIEAEWCKVTATGTTLTVLRGYHGTTATTHATNQDIRTWLPNHGTITGATWGRLPRGLAVLTFDVTDDVVDLGDVFSFERTQVFSGCVWVRRLLGFTGSCAMIGRQLNVANYVGWGLNFENDSKFHFTLVNNWGGNNRLNVYSTSTISSAAAKYSLIGFSYDGTSAASGVALYLNGVAEVTANDGASLTSSIITATARANLGARGATGAKGAFCGAALALPRIVTRVVSPSQHASIFQQERHLFGV